MAYKDLLVHVDNGRANAGRVDAALRLAARSDAHLIGLYVMPEWHVPGFVEAQIGAEVMEAQEAAYRDYAAKAKAAFDEAASKAGVAAEWRSTQGDAAAALSLHGRYTDLVVVGQDDERDPDGTVRGLAGRVVLACGRPVLVVPYIGAAKTIGEQVVVAWNASREAVRALNDALPLLVAARAVHVMTFNASGGARGHGEIPSADVCLHLARHGVKAEAQHYEAHDIDVGDMLLSRASDRGADLIVTGGYGHSRLREMALGGVTRHLLGHMTVPVLMAH